MIGIGLYRPKFDHNIGGVLRAAGCYGADIVAIQASRAHHHVRNQAADTQKNWRHIPTIETEDLFATIPVGCIPVAVDLIDGAVNIVDFKHPKNAFYIFGPEDGTLGEKITAHCAHKIYIPTHFCMNLAASVNVVLYDRTSKLGLANDKRK